MDIHDPIVPSRNRTPIRISTTGPAIERCGTRGVGVCGIIGLATVHLTGWWYGWCWRNRRHGGIWPPTDSRPASSTPHVPPSMRSLQQFDRANDQQNDWPGAVKVQTRQVHVLQLEQYADGQKHHRSHDPPCSATRTLATCTASRDDSQLRANSQPPRKIKISGQKRSSPYSVKPEC